MKGFLGGLFAGLIVTIAIAYVKIDKVELLDLHNDARSNKAMALEMNVYCDEAAQTHAEWMAFNNKLDHLDANRNSVGNRLKKPFTICGENIAVGQSSPEEVTRDWLNSPGHRRNITNPKFKYAGFGIAKSKNGKTYWCAVFSD